MKYLQTTYLTKDLNVEYKRSSQNSTVKDKIQLESEQKIQIGILQKSMYR